MDKIQSIDFEIVLNMKIQKLILIGKIEVMVRIYEYV